MTDTIQNHIDAERLVDISHDRKDSWRSYPIRSLRFWVAKKLIGKHLFMCNARICVATQTSFDRTQTFVTNLNGAAILNSCFEGHGSSPMMILVTCINPEGQYNPSAGGEDD